MPESRSIPLALKIAFTLFMAVWVPTIWAYNGPANFLWLCDIANFAVLAALWLESPLLFSSQTVSVLLVQISWMVDFFGRLLFGFHVLGGTEYMFETVEPLWVRSLSFFHLLVPVMMLWAIWKLGYDRRGLRLQIAILWVILPLSLLPDPARNLNWVWEPFGIPQTLMPPGLWLLVCMVGYPLVLYLPAHAALLAWAKRRGRGVVG